MPVDRRKRRAKVSATSVSDPTFREVIGRHLDRDDIAGQNPDVVPPHFAGDIGQDLGFLLVRKFNLEHGIGQCLSDFGFKGEFVILLRHAIPLIVRAGCELEPCPQLADVGSLPLTACRVGE